MQEINLLQNRIKDNSFAWERQSNYVIAFLSFVFILILGAFGFFYYLNQGLKTQLQDTTTQIQQLQSEYNARQESLTEAKVFQAQIANIKTLVKDHIYVSPLLNELSSSAYSRAKFVTLDINEETGRVHLEGEVANYNDMGKVMLALSTSDKFSNVKLQSMLPSTGENNAFRFTIDLNVTSDIFAKR